MEAQQMYNGVTPHTECNSSKYDRHRSILLQITGIDGVFCRRHIMEWYKQIQGRCD